MATRFYFPSAGTAAVSPATQSYTHVTATRRPLVIADSSALGNIGLIPDAADHLVAGDTFFQQFISQPLGIQTFTSGDAFKYAVQCVESNGSNQLQVQIWMGIVSGDGGTALATLRSKVLEGTEVATTITNRFYSGTLSGGYTTSGGERLVIEFSLSGTPIAAGGVQGHNGTMRFGGSASSGDLPENDTETGLTFRPWLEFSNTIVFMPEWAFTPRTLYNTNLRM